MAASHEIRADFDENTIVIYQAYPHPIADAAVAVQRFVPPFSLQRMTWIKPSFLWLMERSNWGRKSGQECVLAVRIARAGWEEALSLGVLTHPEPTVFRHADDWRRQFAEAPVHVQWDPERSIRGSALDHRSIQVGLSRQIIGRYVEEWVTEIRELTPLVRKIDALVRSGRTSDAKRLLPPERVYPVPPEIARRLGMTGTNTKPSQLPRASRRQSAPRSRAP